MDQLPLELTPAPTLYTVTALTAAIQRLLSGEFEGIQVAGEISGWKVWPSGHAYFTLKDQGAQIRCVLFRNNLRYLRLTPADGMAVVARGNVEVRAERGEYQLIISGLEQQGLGQLYEQFERLKGKLREEGLFDEARKRPLPAFPRRVGIVTSPEGAVIRDMISVLRRRWPALHIRLYPTQVQGAGAVEGIVAGIEYFSTSGWPDVVIVGRGGGSLEDLWSFNDERVARAIFHSSVPVVSAVGHETDFTIADFVTDLRAPTPSAAAELVVPERSEMLKRVQAQSQHALRAMQLKLARASHRLGERGTERVARLLQGRLNRSAQRLDELDAASAARLAGLIAARRQQTQWLETRLRARDLRVSLAHAGERLRVASAKAEELTRRRLAKLDGLHAPLAAQLAALSPLRVLERGYSIVQLEDAQVVRDAAQAPAGTAVRIRLHRGRLEADVRGSVE